MTPERAQLEALEPLVVAAMFHLVGDMIKSDPFYRADPNSTLDQKSALFSIAISLRRIADHLEQSTIVSTRKSTP